MSIGDKMFKGALWSSVERLSVQIVSFVLGIILARLLTPQEYGTVGLLIVFISISQVFIDGGFGKALIQKQDRTNKDISTVFYFNLIIAIICYISLWLSAPYISDFYEIVKLTPLLRALALTLLFNAFFAIPNTLLSIEMNFKLITKVTLTATILSGVIAVYLAYSGFGEWAIVYQSLTRSFFMMLLVWVAIKWKPILTFSTKSLKSLFGFGSKLLIGSLLSSAVDNFSSLFIAKVINTRQLGFYTRGIQFADTAFGTINSIINSILLPGLAPLQNNKELLIESTRKVIKTTVLLVAPLFIALTVIAEPLINILLTQKWAIAIPIMQIICVARLITIISSINVNLLYIIGRSDLALKQHYLKIIVRLVLLIVAIPYGIITIAFAELIATLIHFFINTYYPGKYMGYGAFAQLKDSSLIFIICAFLGLITIVSFEFIDNDIVKIAVGLVIFSLIYFSLIKIFNVPEFKWLINKIGLKL